MSLQKIGNLTNAVNTLKKKSGTGKDIISTLSSFGDLSTAAKYLVSTNKKGEKTLSEKTLFNLLKGAYGNLGEEAISERSESIQEKPGQNGCGSTSLFELCSI